MPAAVDYFQRPVLAGNWTLTTSGVFDINNNARIRASGSTGRHAALWTLDAAPGTNQVAEILLDSGWASRNGNTCWGVVVRFDASRNGYMGVLCAQNGNLWNLEILKFTGGVESSVKLGATSSATPQLNDRLRFEVSGSTLTLKLLQGLTGTTARIAEISEVDTDFTSGRCGVGRGLNSQNVEGDDFYCGTLGDPEPLRVWTAVDNQFYVALNGTDHATGTKADPLTMNWLQAKSSTLSAGTTVWLRGGRYGYDITRWNYDSIDGMFVFSGTGTANSPITYRSYPGETAILDPQATSFQNAHISGEHVVRIEGAYVIVRDVEVTNSDNSSPGARVTCAVEAGHGVLMAGSEPSLINSTIHDVGQGISFQSQASGGGTLRGNLNFNNGWNTMNQGPQGHALYIENPSTTTRNVKDNVFMNYMNNSFSSSGYGLHFFSQGGGSIQHVSFVGNVVLGTKGVLSQGPVQSNYTFDRNYTYKTTLQFNGDTAVGTGLTVTNNYFDGFFRFNRMSGATMTDNILSQRGGTSDQRYIFDIDGTVAADLGQAFSSIDRNTYIHTGGISQLMNFKIGGGAGTNYTLTGWKALTGSPDPNSTNPTTVCPAFGATCPDNGATNYAYVRASQDEPGRGLVISYNWRGLSSVAVDVSSILQVGDQYELRDAQNWSGAPFATGTYGGGTLNFDHTLTAIQAPTGQYTADPVALCGSGSAPAMSLPTHTPSEFGVFIVRRRQQYQTVAVTLYNAFSSATQARLYLGASATQLDHPSITVAIAHQARGTFTVDTHLVGKMFYRWEYLSAGGAVVARSDVQSLVVQ